MSRCRHRRVRYLEFHTAARSWQKAAMWCRDCGALRVMAPGSRWLRPDPAKEKP